MRNKKLVALFLALCTLVFVACGNEETTSQESASTEESTATSEVSEEVSEEVSQEASEEATTGEVLRLTTTTSVNDSGLMEALRAPLQEDTGMTMEIVSKGSGAAIEDGQQGNADVILVHSPAAEKEFVDEGYGIQRTSFMHNYFVIVGPSDDPAGIKELSAEEAFQAIAESGSMFASRGDDSGTHTKEKNIWEGADQDLATVETADWYSSLGDGMGATLTYASETGAYTLTDLSTFLSMENELDLEVLVDQSDSLKNVYSVIVVNPDKVDGTNVELAKEFESWITGENASKVIEEYGQEKYGQSLFFLGE